MIWKRRGTCSDFCLLKIPLAAVWRFWRCHQLSWKNVNKKLNTVFLVTESGADHLPIKSSMDLLIFLCTWITEAVFFFNVDFQSIIWKISVHNFKGHETWPLSHDGGRHISCSSHVSFIWSPFTTESIWPVNKWKLNSQHCLYTYQAPSLPQTYYREDVHFHISTFLSLL